MIKSILKIGLMVFAVSVNSGSQASLVNGSILNIDAGVGSCVLGSGVYPYCDYGATISGSYFDLGLLGSTLITGVDGIHLGTIQPPGYSHAGPITGTEGSSIDIWEILGNTGMHYTTSETNVLSSIGNMATIDFSGWALTHSNSVTNIDLGSGAWGGNADGIANIICGLDCGNGDTYTLTYTATIPLNDPTGYGGMAYSLNLTGTISAVPAPAAVWLFGSGLIGLIGVARRKKS